MGTVVIKGVDEKTYRSLKSAAIKAGLRVGEAASQAFRLWAAQRELRRVRDTSRQLEVSRRIDKNRRRLRKVSGWSSVKVIREWRERRRG